MIDLNGLRVAAIVSDGFEESELLEPMGALKDLGAQVDIIAPKGGRVQAVRHMEKAATVPVDHVLKDVSPDGYDALLLPGGALNADYLRSLPEALTFVG